MFDPRTRRCTYCPIAIALIVALICSLVPSQAHADFGFSILDFSSAIPYLQSHSPSPSLSLYPVSISTPLSISRLQSAYTPGALISGTLAITFTISNNQLPVVVPQVPTDATLTDTVAALQAVDFSHDPNVIRNVLLVDSLASGAAVASSTPRFDRKNGQSAWNLGDIPPLQSITVTLSISIPNSISTITALDTGAKAWGTLQNRPVSAQACPVTLTPDTLSGQPMSEYLQPTVDANLNDEYIARLAGQLCPNLATQAFKYVKTLGYEAYKGSLRGARGTLWSGAGNSLDKSSLLIATLRGNGIPARYRHGALSTARAQELILSMFPTKPSVVGYVPEGAEVSDPANDSKLLAEAQDHWWVEAYQGGVWVAMDPSFSYAAPGQTFATPEGNPLAAVPDDLRHKVTISLEIERYEPITYLQRGFVYTTPLTYTLATAELAGQPLTLKHLVSTQRPPAGCLVAMICWKHHTYIPYLRVGDNPWIVQGHPYWELLSSFPFAQSAITGMWLHFELRDANGNVKTYTRELGDRLGIDKRNREYKIRGLIPGLLTGAAMDMFSPNAPAIANALDNHTIYLNPSLMSPEYAARVGESLLATAPRILEIQPLVSGLGDLDKIWRGELPSLLPQVKTVTEVTLDATQAFNRLLGASFVTFSDAASRDLADTGLVRAYPDSPRITMVSMVISPTRVMTEAVPLQVMDLLYDSLRVIAYPGQVKGAEPTYRMTRGMNEAFLEKTVGEQLTGANSPLPSGEGPGVRSAAGVLQAATAQSIPLMYVDAQRLELLADAPISQQAKARIAQATQHGYGVLVPERMVAWEGQPAIAWWQLDLKTGEVVDVSEDGTHQHLVIFAAAAGILIGLAIYYFALNVLIRRFEIWQSAAEFTWRHFWEVSARNATTVADYTRALEETKRFMNDTIWPAFEQACNEANLVPIYSCSALR